MRATIFEPREPLQMSWPGWAAEVGVGAGAVVGVAVAVAGGSVGVAVAAGTVAVAVGAGGVAVALGMGVVGVVGELVGVSVGVGPGPPSRPLQATRRSTAAMAAARDQGLRPNTLTLRFRAAPEYHEWQGFLSGDWGFQ
ncbi:MAG TPA: hypothetical protein VIH05_00100 [Tepidiformaceae bacterium]